MSELSPIEYAEPTSSSQGESENLRELEAFLENPQNLRYLKRVAFKALGQKFNEHDAEEVVQIACLNGFKHINTFVHKSQLKTWLCQIVVNVCRDWQRSPKNKQKIISFEDLKPKHTFDHSHISNGITGRYESDTVSLEEIRQNPSHSQLHAEVENNLLAEKVRQFMKEKHPEKWKIMELMDIQGLTYEEAAELLNKKVGTLKSGHSRAREIALEYLNRKTSLDRFKTNGKDLNDSKP